MLEEIHVQMLFDLSRKFQQLKAERELCSINPFRIHSKSLHTPQKSTRINTNSRGVPEEKVVKVVEQSFAERYASEVARPQQERKLAAIAEFHKSKFLKESEYLRRRFSKELEETEKMERNIGAVTGLIGKLSQILSSQSELVDDMHGSSAAAASTVKQTEVELLETVKRTESSQTNLSFLIAGLALLLLVLEFLSP